LTFSLKKAIILFQKSLLSKGIRKMFLRIFCLYLCLLSLVACGEKENKSGPKPLIVITSPDQPPFEFKDTAQGGDKVIGFDMDVIQKVGEHLGRPIKIIEADFAGIIPALQSGRADMGIADLSATDERRKSVDFSDPYYTDKKTLLVLEDSAISSEEDLHDKKIGAQLGSTNATVAQKWAASMPGLSVVTLGKVGELVQELKNGRIQAVVVTDTTSRKIASSTPGLKVIVLKKAEGGPSAIAFPKGSPLVGPTNEALKAMKGDIEQLETKWFIQ
jgi:polar amino acid transport system substrate-binding protein